MSLCYHAAEIISLSVWETENPVGSQDKDFGQGGEQNFQVKTHTFI